MSRRWIERDLAVAVRIKEARIAAGLTQVELGERIGVTYQQAHKYERGMNRVTAAVLEAIAKATGRPVVWFYGADEQPAPRLNRLALELMQEFTALAASHQRSLVTIARELRKAAA